MADGILMQKKTLTQHIGLLLLLTLAQLCPLPAYAADDFNQQLDELAKKLASAAQGDVVKGNDTQVYISLGRFKASYPLCVNVSETPTPRKISVGRVGDNECN